MLASTSTFLNLFIDDITTIPYSPCALIAISWISHQRSGPDWQLMIAGVDSIAIFPFHTDIGCTRVVSLKHRAFGAFDT